MVTSLPDFRNPVIFGERGQDHGDPFVIRHRDEYFLYHSGGTPSHRGIPVYRSTDLVDWTYEGSCLEPAHDEEAWNWADLWAPEVVYSDGVFVMYVTATTKRRGRPATWHEVGPADAYKRHIGIARSASPRGPFVWDGEPLRDDCYNIDGSPFRDVDGSEWLFFVRRVHAGYSRPQVIGIAAQRLVEGRLDGPEVEVASPSEAWESRADGSSIIEGPFVVRRHGRYYAFFSGSGYQERTYGAGYAVADQLIGPWVKYAGNPFWAAVHPVHGPGHFALVLAPDGATPYVVYHAYALGEDVEPADLPINLYWSEGRKVLLDRFYWSGDRPLFAGPTAGPQPMPPGPVFHPEVRTWRAEVWLEADVLRIDGAPVPLGSPARRHLQLTQGLTSCVVAERGAVLAEIPGCLAPVFDAEVHVSSLTSFLDDETVHELVPGQMVSRPWGNTGEVELNVAVRGRVRLSMGTYEEEAGDDSGAFSLVVRHLPAAAELTITALDRATVTDLLLYARRSG